MGRMFNQGFIYVFQNEEHPNLYLVFEHGKDCDWYDRFKRLGRFSYKNLSEDEKAEGIDFGYPKLKVKKPLRIEVDENYKAWNLLSFLRERYFTELVIDPNEPGLEVWGWYKYDGKIELEKWLNDFTTHENRRREEFLKATNAGTQTAMF